jgi:uncharacterized membrane protein
MSQATESTQEKSRSTLMKAATLGMSALGSSAAGNTFAGNSVGHADHGHSVARWVGVVLSFAGFLIGGVLFPFAMVPGVIVAGVFQLAAVVSVPMLNAAGFGRHDAWAELKAEAAAERVAV